MLTRMKTAQMAFCRQAGIKKGIEFRYYPCSIWPTWSLIHRHRMQSTVQSKRHRLRSTQIITLYYLLGTFRPSSVESKRKGAWEQWFKRMSWHPLLGLPMTASPANVHGWKHVRSTSRSGDAGQLVTNYQRLFWSAAPRRICRKGLGRGDNRSTDSTATMWKGVPLGMR